MKTRTKLFLAVMAGFGTLAATAQQDAYTVDGPGLYRIYCASCHGVDGKGMGPAAGALKKAPPDLTTLSKRNGGQFPSFRIEHIIDGTATAPPITAHGTHEMPVWGELLPQHRDEALLKMREHNLTEYLRSMQK